MTEDGTYFIALPIDKYYIYACRQYPHFDDEKPLHFLYDEIPEVRVPTLPKKSTPGILFLTSYNFRHSIFNYL